MGHPFARFQSHLSILYGYLTPKPYMGNTPPPPSNGDKARQQGGGFKPPPLFGSGRTQSKRIEKTDEVGGRVKGACI